MSVNYNDEGYVKIFEDKSSFTFEKSNNNIGKVNFQSAPIKGKWVVFPVIAPDLETEKGLKFQSSSSSVFPSIYNTKYQTKK